MRKILTLIFILALSVASVFGMTACSEHTHTAKQEWNKDETHHWHACTGEGCTEILDKAEHSYTNGFCVCGKQEASIVTEAQWASALAFADGRKCTVNLIYFEPGGELSFQYNIDGKKALVNDDIIAPSSDDDVYYIYSNNDGTWERDICSPGFYTMYMPWLLVVDEPFSNFAYDAQQKTYSGIMEEVFTVTIKFENCKLVSLKIEQDGYYLYYELVESTTTVNIPTECVSYVIDETEWVSALTFAGVEKYSANVTEVVDGDPNQYTGFIDGDKAMMVTASGQQIVTPASTEGVLDFYMNMDNAWYHMQASGNIKEYMPWLIVAEMNFTDFTYDRGDNAYFAEIEDTLIGLKFENGKLVFFCN